MHPHRHGTRRGSDRKGRVGRHGEVARGAVEMSGLVRVPEAVGHRRDTDVRCVETRHAEVLAGAAVVTDEAVARDREWWRGSTCGAGRAGRAGGTGGTRRSRGSFVAGGSRGASGPGRAGATTSAARGDERADEESSTQLSERRCHASPSLGNDSSRRDSRGSHGRLVRLNARARGVSRRTRELP